mmetsp:Transcript_25974/g.61768  ORF Transcript_25974/g.61768 Transcript_25974/m.61768 type:complete len:255 (-) Transcript_25974:598-1362(-)
MCHLSSSSSVAPSFSYSSNWSSPSEAKNCCAAQLSSGTVCVLLNWSVFSPTSTVCMLLNGSVFSPTSTTKSTRGLTAVSLAPPCFRTSKQFHRCPGPGRWNTTQSPSHSTRACWMELEPLSLEPLCALNFNALTARNTTGGRIRRAPAFRWNRVVRSFKILFRSLTPPLMFLHSSDMQDRPHATASRRSMLVLLRKLPSTAGRRLHSSSCFNVRGRRFKNVFRRSAHTRRVVDFLTRPSCMTVSTSRPSRTLAM